MRYLISTNAQRPTVAAGHSFRFEPVAIRGGTWLGVLEVDDPLASSILSESPDGVDEIPFERYDSLKKKLPAPQTNWPTQNLPHSPGITVAAPAASPTAPIIDKPSVPKTVQLASTDLQPPIEPLLAQPSARNRGRQW